MNDLTSEPFRSYNYALRIGNDTQGYFTSITGLEARIQPISYREGGGTHVRKLRGRVEYAEVELWYGVSTSLDLWRWLENALSDGTYKQNLTIALTDPQRRGREVRWNLYEAWPCRWRAQPLDGLASQVAIESMTLAFDYLEREASEAGGAA